MTITAPCFDDFIAGFGDLLSAAPGEDEILGSGGRLLEALIARDDWLPARYAQSGPVRYTQYLLHLDGAGRFGVVSFVWGPGQATPIHDHTVWGLVGVLRGAELSQAYVLDNDGLRAMGDPKRLEAGDVEAVSPRIGDIHRVSNAFADRTSISIHVYGGDIGRISRHAFAADGRPTPFVSGYADAAPAGQ